MQRSSASDWNRNLETILRWSPFSSEADLLQEVILLFLLPFCHILVVEVSGISNAVCLYPALPPISGPILQIGIILGKHSIGIHFYCS